MFSDRGHSLFYLVFNDPGQYDGETATLTHLGFDTYPPLQYLSDHLVHDRKAQARSSGPQPGGKEGIKYPTHYVRWHTNAIIREHQFDTLIVYLTSMD